MKCLLFIKINSNILFWFQAKGTFCWSFNIVTCNNLYAQKIFLHFSIFINLANIFFECIDCISLVVQSRSTDSYLYDLCLESKNHSGYDMGSLPFGRNFLMSEFIALSIQISCEDYFFKRPSAEKC